jgi:hypothetical protein
VRGTHSSKSRRGQVLTLLKVDFQMWQSFVCDRTLSLCTSSSSPSVLGQREWLRRHGCFAQCVSEVSASLGFSLGLVQGKRHLQQSEGVAARQSQRAEDLLRFQRVAGTRASE